MRQAKQREHQDTVELQYLRALTEKVDGIAAVVNALVNRFEQPPTVKDAPKTSTPEKKASPKISFGVGDEVNVFFKDDDWVPATIVAAQAGDKYAVQLQDEEEPIGGVKAKYIAMAWDENRILAIEEDRLAAYEAELAKNPSKPQAVQAVPPPVPAKKKRGRAPSAKTEQKREQYRERLAGLMAGVPYTEAALGELKRRDLAKLAKALGGSGKAMIGNNDVLIKIILEKAAKK
jgi:hypothetical protein